MKYIRVAVYLKTKGTTPYQKHVMSEMKRVISAYLWMKSFGLKLIQAYFEDLLDE